MSMTKTQVMELLKENRNERGIENWKKMGVKTGGLKSFGIGLTQLRKLAKRSALSTSTTGTTIVANRSMSSSI